MTEFYVVWKGVRSGPFDEAQIVLMLERGEISAMHAIYRGDDLVDTQALLESLSNKSAQAEEQRSYQASVEARDAAHKAAEAMRWSEREQAGPPPPPTPPPPVVSTPPPPGTKVQVERGGDALGQFSKSEIQAGLAADRFHGSDQIWDATNQAWVSIESTGEFILPAKQRGHNKTNSTMNDKKEFTKQMRAESAYPIFRQVVNALATIGYIGAAICALVGIVLWIQQLARQSDTAAWIALLGGFGYGFGLAIMTLLYQGFLVMVADIADSMLDMNRRRNGE